MKKCSRCGIATGASYISFGFWILVIDSDFGFWISDFIGGHPEKYFVPEAPNPKLRDIPPPEKPAGVSALAYAELDIKTNFSFLRGASHPDELVYRAAELGYRAIAVTDFNSLAGVVRAHEAAKESGISLLIGSRLTFSNFSDLLVWAPDRAAYARLCRLLTLGKRRAQKGECSLELSDFLDHSEGLLAAVVCASHPTSVGSALADASSDGPSFPKRVRQGGPYNLREQTFLPPLPVRRERVGVRVREITLAARLRLLAQSPHPALSRRTGRGHKPIVAQQSRNVI